MIEPTLTVLREPESYIKTILPLASLSVEKFSRAGTYGRMHPYQISIHPWFAQTSLLSKLLSHLHPVSTLASHSQPKLQMLLLCLVFFFFYIFLFLREIFQTFKLVMSQLMAPMAFLLFLTFSRSGLTPSLIYSSLLVC